MKRLFRVVGLVVGLGSGGMAAAQPTPVVESPSAAVSDSIRAWIADQRTALRGLEPTFAEAEASGRQFRDYLRRMRTDAAAQRTILALGDLRPFELERAEANWGTWRAISQKQLEAVAQLSEAMAERKRDGQERKQLLDDDVAAELVPQASQAYQEAKAWEAEADVFAARFEALLRRAQADAEAAVALCDEVLALLVRFGDRMRSRFLLERTSWQDLGQTRENLRKDGLALLSPLQHAWMDTSFGDAMRRNAPALVTAALLLAFLAWRVRRWASGLETAADTLGEKRSGFLARLLACLLIALSRTLGLAFLMAVGIVANILLGGESPAWRDGLFRFVRELFLWRMAVAFVRVAFAHEPSGQRLFPSGDADLARQRLERGLLWFFVGQVQATLLGYVGLLSAPVMLLFTVLLLFGLRSIADSLRDDRLVALGFSDAWAIAARQWRSLLITVGVAVIAAAGLGYLGMAWVIALSALRVTMAVLVAALIWRAGAEVIESRGAPVPGARQHMHVVWGVAIVTLLAMSLPAAIGAAGPALRALDALLDWSFDVGGQKISIGRVLVALLWIFAAWALSRVINFTLTQRILPHASVDAGVRQAITATVGYLLIAVGVLFAIRALGYDLTSLAIVAGALSVGVGFGMQNLVSNFVSGLIILYERPFRPGDILDVDGTMGTVKKIQTRSTIVQTFDESDLVLPNSELLAKPITNWTLTNYLARAVVTVGVAYGSNVELVRELLHDAAAAHPRVIDEPKIYFHAFGDSALEFRLMVWVDVREKLQVLSDLHFAIDRVFREKGISIPFPQRELRVHAVGE